MRREIRRAEDFGEGDVADTEAPGVSAERRHHGALAIGGEAAALGDTGAGGDPGFGMQVAGDLAERARWLVAEGDRADADFTGDDAAKVRWQRGIVVACDPDP